MSRPERLIRAHRFLAVGPVAAIALSALTGCGLIPDKVTDCDTGTEPVTCQRDERFGLAETSVVVDEIETVTEAGDEGEDHAHVEARITVETEPAGELRAQLRLVNSPTDEVTTIDPDSSLTTGEQTLTWDFSGQGYAKRIQFDVFPPDISIVFSDAGHEVTVNVMSVEYS